MDNLARKVIEIPATRPQAQLGAASRCLRVAAYCRVSTDEEEQKSSYDSQIKKYTEIITSNPDWTMAGIFADEGITGTSTKKRDEFNRMMRMCKQGKIDLILVKAISRFARNTLDCIDAVRKLKLMNIGVMFEKENINTLHMSNEMIFTMLSAFAQAESESISENVRWGKRHKMKQGHVPFQYSKLLGYEKGPDGKPMIVPEQAAIVRRIYASYLAGKSIAAIKAELEAEGVPSPSGKTEWSQSVIRYALSNEKYIGDALLQKTYVVDCISKQVRKNNGEVPQFYVENNHEAIISRDIFHRVQEEIARRSSKRRVSDKCLTEKGKYCGKYALSELLICGERGTRYRRTTWARHGKKKVVWRCINRLENGTQHCKQSPTIEESRLHEAILRAINQLLNIREDVLDGLDEALRTITGAGASAFDRQAAKRKIAELETLAADILALTKENALAGDFFEGKLTELYDERAALLGQLAEDEKHQASAGASSARLEALMTSIRSAPMQIEAYDDAFTREHVQEIKVIDAETLVVTFKGGVEVEAKVGS